MPAPFDFGPKRSTWLSHLLTNWIGDEGWLYGLNLRFTGPVFAGDISTCKGEITRKYVEEGKHWVGSHFVECKVWAENQRGEVSTGGTATVILPSRAGNA